MSITLGPGVYPPAHSHNDGFEFGITVDRTSLTEFKNGRCYLFGWSFHETTCPFDTLKEMNQVVT